MTLFEEKVYRAVRRIPKGRITTYAAIAQAIGNPRAARAVGNTLNKNPFMSGGLPAACLSGRQGRQVPCHRVVRSDGFVGGYATGIKNKINLLKSEGVEIKNNRVLRRG